MFGEEGGRGRGGLLDSLKLTLRPISRPVQALSLWWLRATLPSVGKAVLERSLPGTGGYSMLIFLLLYGVWLAGLTWAVVWLLVTVLGRWLPDMEGEFVVAANMDVLE